MLPVIDTLRINKVDNKLILQLVSPVVLWLTLYIFSTDTSMIFSGDSLEYLRMANNVRNGQLPISDAFMPLYPILLGFISWATGLDLFISVRICNGLTVALLILFTNYIAIKRHHITTVQYVFLNSIFISSTIFLQHSITLMPEILFLSFTLLFLYFIFRFIEVGTPLNFKWVIIFSILALLCWLTKYNGFANLVLLSAVVFISKKNYRGLIFTGSILLINILFYALWLKLKKSQDFLIVSALSNKSIDLDYIKFFTYQIEDLVKSFLIYFGNDRIYIFLKDNHLPLIVNILIVIIGLVGMIYLMILLWRNKNYGTSLIISYILLYVLLLNLRSLPVVKTELNTRTLFYPLFLISTIHLYFAFFYSYGRNGLAIIIKRSVQLSFILITLVQIKRVIGKSIQYNDNMHQLSLLGDPRFDLQDSELMKAVINKTNAQNITLSSVLTNQEKIIGIYNNFIPAGKIPSEEVFNGNRNVIDQSQYMQNQSAADSLLYTGKGILAFFYPRTGPTNPNDLKYIRELDLNRLKLEKYPEGYIISLSRVEN